MLSFFPLYVLDEIWDLIELVLRVFLPTITLETKDTGFNCRWSKMKGGCKKALYFC